MKTASAVALKEIEDAEGTGWIRLGGNRGLPQIYLYPGSVYVAPQPCAVTTVLGSCVAVCMWDSRRRVGGVNHFLLPQSADGAEPSTRYADVAVPQLVEALLALGCNKQYLQAKLFGGANVVKAFRGSGDLLGMQNAQVAGELLEAYGVPVVTCDLGGQQGRKVIFHIQDGVAWVKKL